MDTLPDDVLLAIFHSYLDEYKELYRYAKDREVAWQSLVHVCHRWRCIVFGSPRHLNLQLVCTGGTRTRDLLDIWTSFPLIIKHQGHVDYAGLKSVDNITAGLERTDRVCRIELEGVPDLELELIFGAMRQPFPELTHLCLWLYDGSVPVVPDSFLGGSAPRLESLLLRGVPFPGLRNLLLSAIHLVSLTLDNIPHSGYISPEAIVTVLSTLTSLRFFTLKFQSPRSCPGQASRRLPLSTRSVLPVLTYFWFKGVSEYLDDLVAHIDAPQLNDMVMVFFNDVVFDTPQVIQFINRTPTLSALDKAHITFCNDAAYVKFLSQTSSRRQLVVEILCRGFDWQVSSLEEVCTSYLPSFSMMEDLSIYKRPDWTDWKDNIENGLWLELLHPFTAVKNLRLCDKFAPRIAPALQELAEGKSTEVLPTLQNIFLEELGSSGPVEQGIGQFVAARQVAGHPLAISWWDNAKEEKITYYNIEYY